MRDKFFVPFETAKALEEKGYPQNADYYYNSDGKRYSAAYLITDLTAPTYHEVVDWLEGKDIYISVIANFNFHTLAFEYYCHISNYICDLPTEDYPTREEALNAAILKALFYI